MKKANEKPKTKKIKRKDPEVALQQLGVRIRNLRIAAGYSSYEWLAYDSGIGRAQLGRYENGSNMNVYTLVKLANALGVTLEEFFSEGFE